MAAQMVTEGKAPRPGAAGTPAAPMRAVYARCPGCNGVVPPDVANRRGICPNCQTMAVDPRTGSATSVFEC